MELVASGAVEGVRVGAAPVGGAVWDRGALLRLTDDGIAWSMAVEPEPVLAAAGRRLYVGAGATLACLELETGAALWAEELDAPVTALDAGQDGVLAAAGGGLARFDRLGRPGAVDEPGREARAVLRAGGRTWLGDGEGVWRVEGGRASLHHGGACRGLRNRAGRLQALVDGPSGTVLVEDDGLAMAWAFPAFEDHHLVPWGAAEWAVAPRAGRSGVWIVDRRVTTIARVALPGTVLGMAVAGRAVVALLEDGGRALALVHPDAAEPLLLAADGAEAIFGADGRVCLTHADHTAMFRVREP